MKVIFYDIFGERFHNIKSAVQKMLSCVPLEVFPMCL